MATQIFAVTLCVLGLGAIAQARPSELYPAPAYPVPVPIEPVPHHKVDVVGAVGHHLHGKVGFVSHVVGNAVGTAANQIAAATTHHLLNGVGHIAGALLSSSNLSSLEHKHVPEVVVAHPAPVVPEVPIPAPPPTHHVPSYGTPFYR